MLASQGDGTSFTVLHFGDDGHGVLEQLESIFYYGYDDEDEDSTERELNREFHRGMVVALDSLGEDALIFSINKDDKAKGQVQLARYGRVLNQLKREMGISTNDGSTGKGIATLTFSMRLGDGTTAPVLLKDGEPAFQEEVDLLLRDSIFADLAAVEQYVRSHVPGRGNATGFWCAVTVKPSLGLVVEGDDIKQGSFSLRDSILKRQTPANVGLPGLTVPPTEVTVQHARLPRPVWDEGHKSRIISRPIQLLSETGQLLMLDARLRIVYPMVAYVAPKPGQPEKVAPVMQKFPSVRVVMPNASVASQLPLDVEALTKALDKALTANWTRYGPGAKNPGQLDGHETDAWTQIGVLLAGKGFAGQTQVMKTTGPLNGLDGYTNVSEPRILWDKYKSVANRPSFDTLNKAMRCLILGGGCELIVYLGHVSGVLDSSAFVSGDKNSVRGEALIKQLCPFVHEALAAYALEGHKLVFGDDVSPQLAGYLKEQEEGAAADPVRRSAAAAAQAAATAAQRGVAPRAAARTTAAAGTTAAAAPRAAAPRATAPQATAPRAANQAAAAAGGHAAPRSAAAPRTAAPRGTTAPAAAAAAAAREPDQGFADSAVPLGRTTRASGGQAGTSGPAPPAPKRGRESDVRAARGSLPPLPLGSDSSDDDDEEEEEGPSTGAKRTRLSGRTQAAEQAQPQAPRCCAACEQTLLTAASRTAEAKFMREQEARNSALLKQVEDLQAQLLVARARSD